jgi:hypothetical protein
MNLELNEEQRSELHALLDLTLRDLSYEIASADVPTFRQMLRRRRETVRTILDGLDRRLPVGE